MMWQYPFLLREVVLQQSVREMEGISLVLYLFAIWEW